MIRPTTCVLLYATVLMVPCSFAIDISSKQLVSNILMPIIFSAMFVLKFNTFLYYLFTQEIEVFTALPWLPSGDPEPLKMSNFSLAL